MKYKHTYSGSKIAALFGYDIEVPDELGAVLRSHKHGVNIMVVCEHGMHIHKLTKRNPQVMKARGIHAKVINILG